MIERVDFHIDAYREAKPIVKNGSNIHFLTCWSQRVRRRLMPPDDTPPFRFLRSPTFSDNSFDSTAS